MGFPHLMDFRPPPLDEIPYGKSSPSMGFIPPPPKKKQIAHAVPILHINIFAYSINPCSAKGFLPGRFAIWYYFPWGSSDIRFLPGEMACHMLFHSWGTFAIWYYFPGDNLPWYLCNELWSVSGANITQQ